MEKEFEELLEDYLDEEEIKDKIKLDKDEVEEEKKSNRDDLATLREYAISIPEFLRDYLKTDISNIKTNNLTHRNFKDLTQDNPLVIGIYNKYVDIDEVLKKDYLIVTDCNNNIGSYLNPNYLRDLTKLEIIKKQLSIMKKIRISILNDLEEYYKNFMEATEEYEYLNHKCSGYVEMLEKVGKKGTVKKLKKYVDKYGADSIDID